MRLQPATQLFSPERWSSKTRIETNMPLGKAAKLNVRNGGPVKQGLKPVPAPIISALGLSPEQ
ncbi:MAG: hypothetical protein FWG55_02085 [Candidatus Bathyarchaeota archaeon]|nr:hypothetical protein [Candidatus Termiticorpusculum sp.]